MRNPIYKHGQFPCVMIYTPQLNTRISDGIRPSAKYAMTNKKSVQQFNFELRGQYVAVMDSRR